MKKAMHLVMAMIMSAALSACALMNERQYYYGFGFNNRYDGQTALVLDYKLMAKDRVLTSARKIRMPSLSEEMGISGPSPTSIYVKWKEPSSDVTFERSIDLSGKLDEDLDSKIIYLMFKDDHFSIYLISKNLRPKGEPLIGPDFENYHSRKVIYSE